MSAHHSLPTSTRMEAARLRNRRDERFRLRMRIAAGFCAAAAVASFVLTLSQPGV